MQYHTLILLLFAYVQGQDVELMKVDIYPGFGWDNLRFLEMLPIFDVSNFNASRTFQQCMELLPINENKIEMDSTIIDLFNSQSHEFASNFMIGGSAGFGGFKISGSYSNEFSTRKTEQSREKTIALHNQISYLMVDVMLSRKCPLSEHVKRDLLKIAEYEMLGQSKMATYEAQLFVKNYGTHYVNRMHIGGSISEDDYIAEADYESTSLDKRLHRVAAEMSFLKTFSVSTNIVTSENETTINRYRSYITKKTINSKGGDVFVLNEPITTWQASVKSKPAVIRRGIENITYIVDASRIPELSQAGIMVVKEKLDEAVKTYIEMNTIHGCMKKGSPSFNWIANLDDGSCSPPEEQYQFGGVFRTCSEDSTLTQRCDNYRIKNYYTNSEQCSSDFTQYLLHTTTTTEPIYRRQCRSCGFLWQSNCCSNVYIGNGQRNINLYGCMKNVTRELSLLSSSAILSTNVFGGFFTNAKVNLVTNEKTCPAHFKEAPGPDGVTFCFADRVAVVSKTIPSFGGMFSCDTGNPIAELNRFTCPSGYSAHSMTAIDGSCLLSICLKFDTESHILRLPPITLPPFTSLSEINLSSEVNDSMEHGIINDSMEHGIITSKAWNAPKAIPVIPSGASGSTSMQSSIIMIVQGIIILIFINK